MPKFMDLTGQRYGELTVLRLANLKIKNRPAWECRCDCGNEKIAAAERLRSGENTSCGRHFTQAFRDAMKAVGIRARIDPNVVRTKTRLYTLWNAMRARCMRPSHEAFARYGGAGITICDEWKTYDGFQAWAIASGYRDDLTIDRINNADGYHPLNCRWATVRDQSRNRKNTVMVTAWGETKPLMDWPSDERCKVSARLVWRRLDAGHPPEFAMQAGAFERRSMASRAHAK